MRTRNLWLSALALILLFDASFSESATGADLVVAEPAVSAPAAPYIAPPEWQAAVAAYVWGAGMNGTIGVLGLPAVDVDISFIDILDHLDFAAMAVGQVRYDRFGLFSDLVYVKISAAAATPLGRIAERAGFGQEIAIATLTGTYDFSRWERLQLQAMAGARIWSVETKLNLSGGRIPAGRSLRREQQETWVDPLIGLQARYELDDRWFLTGWGMVSGFGAAADFGWDVLGAVGYEFNDRFSLAAGYRGAGVDYTNDGFVWDVAMHGPIIGGVIRF
jgi:hypothetical protein